MYYNMNKITTSKFSRAKYIQIQEFFFFVALLHVFPFYRDLYMFEFPQDPRMRNPIKKAN